MTKEPVIFATEDKWMRVEGGVFDPVDKQILNQASKSGPVKVVNIKEMLEIMMASEPEKFESLKNTLEKQEGLIQLTFDEMVELARKVNETISEFTFLVAPMDLRQASQIRHWRINNHMTWRALSAAAYQEGWFDHDWSPPSNQLMGMALAEKAATLFGENYREEPWN